MRETVADPRRRLAQLAIGGGAPSQYRAAVCRRAPPRDCRTGCSRRCSALGSRSRSRARPAHRAGRGRRCVLPPCLPARIDSALVASTIDMKRGRRLAQTLVAHPAAAGHVVVGELPRLELHLVGEALVPERAAVGRSHQLVDDRPPLALEAARARSATSPLALASARSNAIASSNARRVPEPMEKCPVRSASPISTMLSTTQLRV